MQELIKMKNIVEYHNTMNTLNFKGFTAMDYNVLMALCYKLRDQGKKKITLTFSELRELTASEKSRYTNNDFEKLLDHMIDKLLEVKATHIRGNEKSRFVLFRTFTTDAKNGTLIASVNEDFYFILNELSNNFTQFELREFAELDSRYEKTLYRILKQYKISGWWKPTTEELKEILDIPNNYTNKMIVRDILKPAITSLSSKFNDLKCEPIRAKKRGAPIERFYFTFTAEKQIEGQTNINDAIEQMQNYNQEKAQMKKQAQKNSFNNFKQNQYDFTSLEEKLLDN